ncbi:MAG: SpoIIE family protein phosphatase [Bacteroidales bacterium]|nr:SpoIIE family protein phosphatase [Bacteroidales bacterium]
MAAFIDRIRIFFKERKGSRLVLILLTALLLELVAVLQYTYTRNLLIKEEERITRMELTMESDVILNTLEEAELSMRENEWSVQKSLAHPDSLFGAVGRMIRSNPSVAGACIAVLPDYYPEKGRLFEPYAHKEGGRIVVDQIAGPDHDYTLGPDFQRALREETDFWSDPYAYGTDPVQQLTTYTYPIWDRSGRLAAICGLDIDLTWLSDTLNVHPYYPSSFGFMLTRNGRLVAGPREERVSPQTMAYVADLVMDPTVDRTIRGRHRVNCIEFRDPVNREWAYLDFRALPRSPGWIVAEVSYRDEVLAPVRSMMWRILLMALAGLAFVIFIIERFARVGKRLWESDVKQARIESELRIARRIQEEMLPKSLLDRADLAVQGFLAPAKEVGGDLFDYFVRDEKLFFCIGDVCGKGIPAAMVMAVAHSLLRQLCEQEEDPACIVGKLNGEACRNNESGVFLTLFLGVLDLTSGRLRYCNAGHEHPLFIRDTVEELPALANVPVGAFNDFEYRGQETDVAPGAVLFLYTDGVSEAMDINRQQYGRKRLRAFLSGCSRQPDALVHAVGDSVRTFVGAAGQSDDITMLALRYREEQDKNR